jgi:hypothetical protein
VCDRKISKPLSRTYGAAPSRISSLVNLAALPVMQAFRVTCARRAMRADVPALRNVLLWAVYAAPGQAGRDPGGDRLEQRVSLAPPGGSQGHTIMIRDPARAPETPAL